MADFNSVWNNEIIAATTAEVTSLELGTRTSNTLVTGVLAAGESIKIQFTHNGSDWQDLILNGVLQELTATHTMITISGLLKYRVVKSATATAISVNMWQDS